MPDAADQAQESEAVFFKVLMAERQNSAPRGESAETCAECGKTIPETRRKAVPGCQLCRSCQEVADEG
jgi:phage/conjugal plasmid C-4 type zinc finger TraR family protein